MPWCLLLTGEPNSGKSTIAYELVQNRIRNCLVIDGDKHREAQFLGKKLGFSRDDIMENTEHVIKLARFALEQGFNVIIAQIAPYKAQRALIRDKITTAGYPYKEVYCFAPHSVRSKRPNFTDSELIYEESDPDLIVYTSNAVNVCVDAVMDVINDIE